ncbi:uncharacterized protein C8Q71DRAFT_862547 [Rhodofomes roseus]|uniref:Uncharacterized protein n=1 Tax=Rhodofomes roseus TaxID=34475 RepID=A0ABQ8K1L3_9APHY|nr:uncharacterized protein C8Q71DRAFT_862547 [Rhodofomes roseus]KAH9830540.1 hypothetical protein C8Q71DRAFT_862547 [Rhodofomes roseus]
MSRPSRATRELPRFRSSLWVPMDYQVLPLRPQVRDKNWPLYSAHRAVRAMAALEDGSYAVSPNADYVPSPPPGPRDHEDVLSDGRRGIFEPGFHPQYWSSARGHLPFIYEIPPGAEGVDPAYVLLDCKRNGRRGNFHILNNQSGKGKSDSDFIIALTGLYDAELLRAEGFLSRDRDPPKSLVLRPADVKEARYQFEYIDSNLETARKHVATIQRHLLELRAYAYRSYLQKAFDEGRLAAPSPSLVGVGCWVRGSDEDLIKRLVWFGIPVWYSRREGPAASQLLLRIHSVDGRLSNEPWDEEEHGPPPEKTKKSSRRQKQRAAEFLSADEDSDFDWEKSRGLRRPAPVAGPSLPMTVPSARPLAGSPIAALTSVAEEEGWVNQPAPDPTPLSSPPRLSSPLGRRMDVSPPPRVDSPMVLGSPPPSKRVESATKPSLTSSSASSSQLDRGKRRASPSSRRSLLPPPITPLAPPCRTSPSRLPARPSRPRSPPRRVSPPPPRRGRSPAPLERASRRRSRSPSPRRDRLAERQSDRRRSPRRLHFSPVRYTPRGMNRPPPGQRIDFDDRRRFNRREGTPHAPTRGRERSSGPSRRSRSPASSTEQRAPTRPATPPPLTPSLPLEQRLASAIPVPPRRSLLDRLEPSSLLSRLNPPEIPVLEEGELGPDEKRSKTSLFERMGLPLESRISEATPHTLPTPPMAPTVDELHTVSLPSGVPLRTRLPLHSAAEVDEYLHHPFERDGNVPVLRLKGEDELGPAPVYPQDAGTPLPSPQLLLAEGDEGYLSTITWLQNRGPCLLRLQRKPEDWVLRNHRQWKSNLRGPPNLVRAARTNPARPLPDGAIDPFRNPLPNERENEIWSLRTFLLGYESILTVPGVNLAPAEPYRRRDKPYRRPNLNGLHQVRLWGGGEQVGGVGPDMSNYTPFT